MGASVEKPNESVEKPNEVQNQTLANGVELKNDEVKESISSCCQGAKGFSCCRDGSSEVKQGEQGVGKFSKWIGQRDVLAAISVVGAVAVVAVAYGFYRRSK